MELVSILVNTYEQSMELPEITIIIPVYNAAEYLSQCLMSCAQQAFKNIEVICVDDGSTDRSLEIMMDFQRRDQRFRIVRQPCNMGTHEARRTGFLEAQSENVLLLDADDVLDKNCCECLLQCAGNADLLLYGVKAFRDEATKPSDALLEQVKRLTAICSCMPHGEVNREQYLKMLYADESATLFPAGKLFKRKLALDVFSRMPKGYCAGPEDGLFLLFYLKEGCRILSVKEVLYYYRMGNGISTCGDLSLKAKLRWLKSGVYCARVLDSLKSDVPISVREGAVNCLVDRPYKLAFGSSTMDERIEMIKSLDINNREFAYLIDRIDETKGELDEILHQRADSIRLICYSIYGICKILWCMTACRWQWAQESYKMAKRFSRLVLQRKRLCLQT